MFLKLKTTIKLFFKILDYEISFGVLILCYSEPCVCVFFLFIRFAKGKLDSFVFILFYFG